MNRHPVPAPAPLGHGVRALALIGADDLLMLRNLDLVNANGSPFDPTTSAQIKTWLSKATATNMAYMLSAQLAAMALNVSNGMVDGSALVYAPDVNGANSAGFIAIDALMAEATSCVPRASGGQEADVGRAPRTEARI